MQFHKAVKHYMGDEANSFTAKRGLRQGSMLFLIVYEYLIRASGILEDPGCGFYFGKHPSCEPGTFGGE